MRTNKRKAGIVAAAICIACLAAGQAVGQAPAPQGRAGSKTANLQVTAEVVPNCIIVRKADVVFGTYDPIGANAAAPKDGQGLIELGCTVGTNVKIELDNGQNAAGTARNMAGPSATRLGYDLFKDAAATQRLGSGSTESHVSLIPSGQTGLTLTVYGRVPPKQNVRTGNYADTILATISY